MNPISVGFGIHCHQPIGQFVRVVDQVTDEWILPFLGMAADHPAFKFCAHFSGAFLTQVESRRPQLVEIVKKMIERGQTELLGGGMYEPILAAQTSFDQTGQIRRFSDYLQRVFGLKPAGLWLAERAWETHLCKPIQESGIKYVILDDQHFAAAAVPVEGVHGYFLTEEFGHRLGVFPIDEGLRNLVSKKEPDEILDYLENFADEHPDTLVTFIAMMDPRHFHSSHQKRGTGGSKEDVFSVFEPLIKNLEKAAFVKLVTPSEWMASHPPRGLLYLPSAASLEMSEWTLPPSLQDEYERFKFEVERHTRAAAQRLFVRGGFWRSYLMKYPESNWMQKRVFAASNKMGPVLEKLGADREARTIRDLLDRAACHDAYWQGSTGGLYRPHLRQAVYRNLLEAENRFSKKMGLFPACYSDDLDGDGRAEFMVYTDAWVIGLKPTLGAAMVEWSYRPALYNFQNILTRRVEGFHPDMKHKHQLIQDRYPKHSGLLHALHPATTYDDFKKQAWTELVPALGVYESKVDDRPEVFRIRFTRETPAISFQKDIVISKRESKLCLTAGLEARGTPATGAAILGVGMELGYGSADSLSIETTDDGQRQAAVLDGETRGSGLEITDRDGGTRLRMKADREIRFFIAPSFAVAASPAGLEKIFQGLSLMLMPDAPTPGSRQEITLTMEVLSLAGTQT